MYFAATFLLTFAASWLNAAGLTTVPSADCGINPVDIHFLLDESASIGRSAFPRVKVFVKDFVEEFEIGPDKAQFGVTTFSNRPINHFWLNTYSDKNDLLSAVGNMPYAEGYTYTADALKFVKDNAFTAEHGSRPGVMKILIVLTDGKSQDKAATLAAAKEIHRSNIIVLSIGVGESFDTDELQAITTDPTRLFHVDNVYLLETIEDKLRKKSCEVCPFWDGKDAVFIDGKCVRYFDTPMNFTDALAACKQEGPTVKLAEIRTEPVRKYIQDKAATGGQRSWVGAEGALRAVWSGTGDVANTDPSWWGQGQPDNCVNNENCVVMRPDKLLDYYSCRSKQPFFCESVEVKVVP